MPKKDGFADQKKEAEKTRKKLLEVKKKDEEKAKAAAREEAEAVAAGGSTSNSASSGVHLKLATDTPFAKAAAAGAAAVEEEEAAEDYDYDVVETTTASVAPKAKKESAADLKKKQKARKGDEFALLAEAQRLAKKQRIKDRFLRMLIVGIVMDFFNGNDSSSNGNGHDCKRPVKEKKAKKAASSDESSFTIGSIKEKLDVLYGPLMMLVIVGAILYGKAMEDGFSSLDSSAANFYDVMGVPRDAEIMDVRKKYKSLALTWHPDKNPDCKECPEKFAAISKAYETLSDPERKKAYDKGRSAKGSFSSAVSIDLTAEDFESNVLRSNEVWVVQVYDPADESSSSFHQLWEEVATTYKHVARFGRIDVSKNKKALQFFPHRVVVMPIVFRFARGEETDSFLYSDRGEEKGSASAPLAKWIINGYPALHKTEGVAPLTQWWKQSDRSRLLISGKNDVIKRGAQNKQFFHVLKEAHMWAEYFAVTTADGKEATEVLKEFGVALPEADRKKGHPWSVTYIPAGATKDKAHTLSTDDLKELPGKIEEVVQQALSSEAPHLTVRNHRQLCGAGIASRTYCLILVDMPNNVDVSKVLQEVSASRAEYAKELAELKDAESEQQPDEAFRIQAVRVMTSTSRFPSQPVAVSGDFYAAWAEVSYAPMFVVELETQRVSAVKPSIVAQLCQQIAYEDLKFKELPEGIHLARTLPDPEMPLKRVLFRTLSSPFGALLFFVLLAAVTAVAPELEITTNLAAGGGLLTLLVLLWPLACRRLLSIVTFNSA